MQEGIIQAIWDRFQELQAAGESQASDAFEAHIIHGISFSIIKGVCVEFTIHRRTKRIYLLLNMFSYYLMN